MSSRDKQIQLALGSSQADVLVPVQSDKPHSTDTRCTRQNPWDRKETPDQLLLCETVTMTQVM